MPEVERHPRQSIGGLWGVALFLSLPLRFQPQLHHAGVCAKATRRGAHASTLFPKVGNCFIENSANQVDGNSLSVALSKRFSAPRASDK
jgi:hypothetical protein